MSVRSDRVEVKADGAEVVNSTIAAAQSADAALGEAAAFNTANPEHPLKRSLVVSVKASLNDLCLRKTRATWAPSEEALRSIFQQQKFTALDGSSEPQGDLKARHAKRSSAAPTAQPHP